MKLYVASSWRCARQPEVVEALRAAGHDVYDFRNPAPGDRGFGWKQITEHPEALTDPALFGEVLTHPVAQAAFEKDMGALRGADATVLVLPCGRSAHLELGYAVAAGQRTVVLLDDPMSEPELMYLMCDHLCASVEEVVGVLSREPLTMAQLGEEVDAAFAREGTTTDEVLEKVFQDWAGPGISPKSRPEQRSMNDLFSEHLAAHFNADTTFRDERDGKVKTVGEAFEEIWRQVRDKGKCRHCGAAVPESCNQCATCADARGP